MRREEDANGELREPGGKVRLYVDSALSSGARVVPSDEQAHYLLRVMRAQAGDVLRLFNGRDGEWRARIAEVTRRGCTLVCEARTEPHNEVPDLWLAFAPIKRTPADYVSQKATELGVRVLQPVITHRTNARRVNVGRMRANAIEAAEQSGRVTVPEVRAPLDLTALLKGWPPERRLIFCDEGGAAMPVAAALRGLEADLPCALLTGPEGGFDDQERTLLRRQSFVLPVTLGPRIMRADTAALAALAVWQAVYGDWS